MVVTDVFDDVDLGAQYQTLLEHTMKFGDRVAPRGDATLELQYVTIIHRDPTDCLLVNVGRGLSRTLAAAEALQLVGGVSYPHDIIEITPRYRDFMDNDDFHGAYGRRTQYKFGHVIDRLRNDPSTRRAVVTIWNNELDLTREELHDYPCTVSLGFSIRDGKLNMRTHMRSNDLWLGYPYDVFQFTALQRSLAAVLNVNLGVYVHQTDSLHIYERDIDKAQHLLKYEVGSRPRLAGGIGSHAIAADPWYNTQLVARQLFTRPDAYMTNNMTSDERWFVDIMSKWRERHPYARR